MLCLCAPAVAPYAIRRWDTGAMVDRARELAGIDMKEFLDLMGITAPAWSRQRAGTGPDHISFDRLSRLPWKFWLWMVVAILHQFVAFPEVEEVITEQVVRQVARLALPASIGKAIKVEPVADARRTVSASDRPCVSRDVARAERGRAGQCGDSAAAGEPVERACGGGPAVTRAHQHPVQLSVR
jgi:hypothetical protein